jgi:ABC-2 type transport system permease protein
MYPRSPFQGLLQAIWPLIFATVAFFMFEPVSNIAFGLLLVFTGANVARDSLPGWMHAAGEGMPFTNAIEAARRLADGVALADVTGPLVAEAVIGVVYAAVGFLLLRFLEEQSRRFVTLERA